MHCTLLARLPLTLMLALLLYSPFVFASEVSERLRHRLEVHQAAGELVAGNETLLATVVLGELYEARDHHPLWLEDDPPSEVLQSLPAASRAASGEGLTSIHYHPMALAHWLLAGRGRTPMMPVERIEQIIESGSETTVRLRQPIPVHLLYGAAWIEGDGRVHYTGDVYQRDGQVLDALEQAPPTPRTLVPQTLSRAP